MAFVLYAPPSPHTDPQVHGAGVTVPGFPGGKLRPERCSKLPKVTQRGRDRSVTAAPVRQAECPRPSWTLLCLQGQSHGG
jgi:hypothetical protein